jgi:hypothetical protein
MASFVAVPALLPHLDSFSEGVASLSHTLKAAEFMVYWLPCAVIEQKNPVRAISELSTQPKRGGDR